MAAHQLIRARFALQGVPVFMYHDVCAAATTEERYTTPLAVFRQHLALLCEQEFAVIELPALERTPSGRNVVLTFDDGLARQYELAFPALLEHRLTATFFVTTALVDSPGYLTWSQLREMRAAGMTIGSHGHQHIDYTGLATSVAGCELKRSWMALKDHLGEAACTFSAPYGFLNAALTAEACRAGFRWICSSRPWLASARQEEIARLAIYNDTDVAQFAALATRSALPLIARRTRNALLHLPKQILLRTSPKRLGVNVGQEAE
jgi:peptidoglycan/xylan/chitin deacetylase (PgdA/CDA1 family)